MEIDLRDIEGLNNVMKEQLHAGLFIGVRRGNQIQEDCNNEDLVEQGYVVGGCEDCLSEAIAAKMMEDKKFSLCVLEAVLIYRRDAQNNKLVTNVKP